MNVMITSNVAVVVRIVCQGITLTSVHPNAHVSGVNGVIILLYVHIKIPTELKVNKNLKKRALNLPLPGTLIPHLVCPHILTPVTDASNNQPAHVLINEKLTRCDNVKKVSSDIHIVKCCNYCYSYVTIKDSQFLPAIPKPFGEKWKRSNQKWAPVN